MEQLGKRKEGVLLWSDEEKTKKMVGKQAYAGRPLSAGLKTVLL